MARLKLRLVGLVVLLSMLFSLHGLLAAPVYATANLVIDPEPVPGDPALCMEDVTATVSWMNKFNSIVLDNVNAPGFTHIDGGAYIGGNCNATSASDFAIQSGPTCADNSLTIVGTVIGGSDLKVLSGNALTGQPTSSRIAMNSGCPATVDNTLSNLTIKAELNAASSAFAAETANNNDPTIDGSGKLIFNVDNVTANGLAIFNVTTAQVFASAANNQIEFVYGGGVNASTTTILVNVSGSDVDWTSNASFGNSVETNAARIIWNFHNATTIDFGKQWFGSMLAPLATLNAGSQNLTGSIAVKNITGAGEVHKPRIELTNTTPLKDVCENPPDEVTEYSVCSDIEGGPFNQLKINVIGDGPPHAEWEYNPLVGTTTSGTAPFLGGSTAAGQSYTVAPFGTIAISTTTAAGAIIAYDTSQTNPRTNWTSTFGIDYVLIKAGPGSNMYIYSPEAYADYLLESPKDSISHVTFCWDSEVTPAPGIAIKKYTNGEDADTPTGPVVSVGSTVIWTYVISNTGNVVLSNIVVTDNIAGVTPVYINGDTNTDNKLDLDEIWLYRTTGIAVLGQYANIGTVTGDSPDEEEVSDTDPSHYFGADPGIAIKKYTNGEDADSPTGPVVTVGSMVTWTYVVSNTGNVVLSNIVVTDNIAGVNPVYISGDSNTDSKLDLNEIWLYRTTGIATAGQYANIGTVKGDSPDEEEVSDDDPSHYFGTTPGPEVAALGDRVWHDLNANGVQDDGEPGVENVTVTLLQGDCTTPTGQSTSTNGSGIYGFANLTPGSYCVAFTVPAGYSVSPQNVGNDTLDSDGDSSGKTTNVTLVGGEENLSIDLGIYQPASLGNRVWIDANENGTQDGGEANVEGVTVTLFNSNNQQVGNPTSTDANGVYLFTNLAPGTYYVIFDPTTLPDDYIFTTPNANGVADTLNSDPDATGKTPSVTLQSGDNYLDLDAGIFLPSEPPLLLATLGDTVWYDVNKNGIQDGLGTPEGEKGVAGVVVNLYTSGGVFVKSDTTDADGKYLFTDLQPGTYYVEFATVEGYSFTRYNVNSNTQNAADSDPLVPWIDITISTSEEDAELGEPLTYIVAYTNTDATLVATNVVISTTVPDGTTFDAAASNPGWQCTNANPGGICTLTLPTLAANSSGSALFVVNLSTSEPDVPDQLDIVIELTQETLARTENVTLAAGETILTVDAGLVIIESTLTTPTPTAPTNLPESGQPQQQRAIFLPTVGSRHDHRK